MKRRKKNPTNNNNEQFIQMVMGKNSTSITIQITICYKYNLDDITIYYLSRAQICPKRYKHY